MATNGTTGNRKHVRLPVKQSINLAVVGVKPIKLYVALPIIILILAAAAAFSKFGVVDRYMKVAEAERQVAATRKQVDDAYVKLAEYDELNEIYAHYTYSGMTNEELNRVDRSDIISLIQRMIIPNAVLDSWSVSGNQLILNITGSSLQEINLLSQKLNDQSIVDFSTVRTASTTETRYEETETEAETSDTDVAAQIIVYLTIPEEEG